MQRVKKGKFGGGRQPRIHPKPPEPVLDRAVKCPCCQQVFAVAIEEPPGAYRIRKAAWFIGGCSVPTMHRLVKRGLIRPNRAMRHLTFAREELLRFVRDNTPQ